MVCRWEWSSIPAQMGRNGLSYSEVDTDFFARMADVKFPRLRHLALDGRMRVQDDNAIPAMVEARDLRARLMPQGYCALESFSIMLRRRYALHRRALVRLHATLREGFFERWAPPPSLYQRPVMSNHDPAAVASTAHARRVRLLDALEDLSATDDEEDGQVRHKTSQRPHLLTL